MPNRERQAPTPSWSRPAPRDSTTSSAVDSRPRRIHLLQGDPGTGKTTLALRFLLEGASRGRAGPLRGPLREPGGARPGRAPRTDGRSRASPSSTTRAPAASRSARPRSSSPPRSSSGTDARAARADRSAPALPHRARLLLRAPAPVAGAAALPPANPRAQGPRRDAGEHHPAPRHPRRGRTGDAAPERGARGAHPRAALAPVRRRAAPGPRSPSSAGGSIAAATTTWSSARAGSTSSRGWWPPSTTAYERAPVSSGVAALDALLGGGPDRGSSLLLMGPAGCGKSAIATQYALAAAERGERAAVFAFDEGAEHVPRPRGSLGMHVEKHLRAGRMTLQQVDPAELSPGEFAHSVRLAVERDGARRGGHRQPEWLPQRHAGGAAPDAPDPRAPRLPRPARRLDPAHRGPARPGVSRARSHRWT